MAYIVPHDLDGFMPHLRKLDTKFRIQLGNDLLTYLSNPDRSIQTQDIGLLVDHILQWTQSSNFKVSTLGIEILCALIDRLGHDFRPYVQTVLPVLLDRLGDAKDAVREKTQFFLLKLLQKQVLSSQILLEKLQPAFSHKNSRIREEILRCVVAVIDEHGTESLSLNKFIPSITRLLSDPTVTVRDAAFNTLVELYKHVGERLRNDIERKNLVPATKLQTLLSKFDQIKQTGGMLPSASTETNVHKRFDEVDRMIKPIATLKKVPSLLTATKKPAALPPSSNSNNMNFNNHVATINTNSVTSLLRSQSVRKPTSTITCAVDEDIFRKAFEDVPEIQIYSSRDLVENLNSIKDIISDPNKEWNKRVDALKKLRSLLINGAHEHDEFFAVLRTLEFPFQAILKDLRSQVVREACITIAHISELIGSKADHFNELNLPVVINLIQNSAKVVATAGIVTVRFIISNTQYSRLIPLIITHITNSRSKEIRRACCDFLEYILSTWPTHTLERHVSLIQQALKTGISDADPEARTFSRRGFKSFKDHFPEQSETLLQSLDAIYRRALQGELSLSGSSSCSSLAQKNLKPLPKLPPSSSSHSNNGDFEIDNYDRRTRATSLTRMSNIPVLKRTESFMTQYNVTNKYRSPMRSNSAIDAQAVKRANVRKQYATLARNKIASATATLPRLQKSVDLSFGSANNTPSPQERYGRTKFRSRSSQSTPSSRANSPSIRLSMSSYMKSNDFSDTTPRTRRLSSGIPRSTANSRDTSRETSPSRRFYSKADRPPLNPLSRPVLAEKLLLQSQEAENAFADSLKCDLDYNRFMLKKTPKTFENHSDDSETSSICSERSFDSYRRHSDTLSWNGSQSRIREIWDTNRSITEIVENCRSTNWKERKEGLIALQYFLNKGNLIPQEELRIIMEIFLQMFVDLHTKVLSTFLDSLIMVLSHHKNYLNEWLYVLLQRTFTKLGGDLLNSTYLKLLKTLEAIKISFDPELQLHSIFRFVVDNKQTPNSKTKIAIMNYLTQLCSSLDETYFSDRLPVRYALEKILSFTEDSKCAELRNAAKACVLSLHNCDPAKMSNLVNDLTQKNRDNYIQIIETLQKRLMNGLSCFSPTPKTISPSPPGASGNFNCHHHNNVNNNNHDVNVNVNNGDNHVYISNEDIITSLQKTSTEIQNYSFDTVERNRETTSQDSGISTGNGLGVVNGHKSDVTKLEEQLLALNLNDKPKIVNRLYFDKVINANGTSDISIDNTENKSIINAFISGESLQSTLDKKSVFSDIVTLIHDGKVEYIKERFSEMLAALINMISSVDQDIQIGTLDVLTEIFQCDILKAVCANFLDLLILKILTVHNRENKEVIKHAEIASCSLASFSFKRVSSILKPLIETNPYPINQAAIKMLMKAVEHHPDEITNEQLDRIMPGLVKAFNHEESPVRKSAVFCIVALNKAVGEDRLSPHLKTLGSCKLKLLNVYISRAQNKTSSLPSSPKTSSNSQ